MKLDARPAPYDATEHAQGAKVNASAFEAAVRRELDLGELAGVVAVATHGTAPLCERAFGWRDLASQAPMTLDTVFMLASMTKTLTSVAALQLVEQGKVGLDQPLGGVVPELADLKVLEGFSAAGAPRLRPAKRSVTLRHLLTHTSGFRTRCMERGHRSLPGGDRTSTIERADQRVVATAAAIRSGRQELYPEMVKRWGLHAMLTPSAGPDGRSAGSQGWGGVANCYFWIDPAKRIAGAFFTQIMPFGDKRALALSAAFERCVYGRPG